MICENFDNRLVAAEWLGNLPSGSAQWHELRKTGLGGSEIGTIAGLNKWESAYTLWAKKTGLIEESFETSEAMEAGTLLESFILEKYFDRLNDVQVYGSPGTYALGWQHANPDGLFFENGELCLWECKTARFEDDWNVYPRGQRGGNDDIPRHYLSQVQWYLRVLGLKRAIVSVLFGGQKYREYEIFADQFLQDQDLSIATHFWNLVLQGEAPDWDGSTSTYETVRAITPGIDPSQSVELPSQLWQDYSLAVYNSKQVESELLKQKSAVAAFMGDAKSATVAGEVVVVRQAGRNGGSAFLVNKF